MLVQIETESDFYRHFLKNVVFTQRFIVNSGLYAGQRFVEVYYRMNGAFAGTVYYNDGARDDEVYKALSPYGKAFVPEIFSAIRK